MYEECYEPLPDIDAYLDRLGIGREEPSLDYLDRLIAAHQCAIPFEDLDPFEGTHLAPLGIAELFDKVVTRRRGGFCYELNGLFYALLQELGFDVIACLARVIKEEGEPGDELYRDRAVRTRGKLDIGMNAPITHRVNLVRMDGQLHLADVGFGGPSPACSLPVRDLAERTSYGQRFSLERFGDDWWTLVYHGSKTTRAVLQFFTMAQDPCVFVPLAYFSANYPLSAFRLRRMVNRRTAEGNVNIDADVFTRRVNGVVKTTQIETPEQLDEILATEFGIVDWRVDQ